MQKTTQIKHSSNSRDFIQSYFKCTRHASIATYMVVTETFQCHYKIWICIQQLYTFIKNFATITLATEKQQQRNKKLWQNSERSSTSIHHKVTGAIFHTEWQYTVTVSTRKTQANNIFQLSTTQENARFISCIVSTMYMIIIFLWKCIFFRKKDKSSTALIKYK